MTSSVQSAPPSGGAGTLTIGTNRDCTWAASSAVSWIVITSGSSGQGDGSAAYRIAANTEAAQRRGAIDVNSTEVAITQDAACRYEVSASTTAVPAEGATVAVNVQSGGTCGWTAASQVAWIAIPDGSSGNGNGVATLRVAANGGAARTGTALVAGQTITITQAQPAAGPPGAPPAASCDATITPPSQAFDANGGSGDISVAVSAGCAWTAATGADWIAVTSGASGSGPGQVHFNVAKNTGASARQGTLTIAGRTFSVAEAGISCGYAIAPSSASFAAAGGTGSVALATNGGCTWTAKSNVDWISISSGASGSGSTTVSFTVAANSGAAARTGTLTIGGQTFSVTQAAPCAYSVTASVTSFPDAGGNGSATITTDSACAWTASSNANWITITNPVSGSVTGSGSVTFAVAANTGPARTGTLSIAGQTITLSQAAATGACSYTIAPPSQSMPDTGGTGSIAVTATGSNCQWTATSNAAWISITAGGTGSGNQSVAYSVAANTGAARTGTLTVAGQTFTVDQAGAPAPPPPCTYSIAPGSQAVAASGATGSVAVTASATTCAWTAASAVDWITITAPGPGQGNGNVDFTIAANAGPPRTGTLTIAGQVFTVNQDGASAGGP